MAYLEATGERREEKLGDRSVKKKSGLKWPSSKLWLPLAAVAAALLGWEWSVRQELVSSLFFPSPMTIARTLARLFESGDLIKHTSATLSRLFLGLVLGGVPGLILGLMMGWSWWLRVVIDPFIAAAHPVPKVAVFPLLMIIFGIGETSKLVVVAIAAFFPMVINAMTGVRQISPIHFEVAKNYGARPLKIFTRVVVPGSLSIVLAGARLALNMTLLITIAVELVSAQEGLGAMIWLAWETLRTEHLYAGLAVIVVLGISFNLIIQLLTRRLTPWQADPGVD
jgi:NitT/TauT family transport system permease protein